MSLGSAPLVGVLGILTYRAAHAGLQLATRRLAPSFYAKLQEDPVRKRAPFFVFLLGVVLTLFTTPICAHAYLSTPQEVDGFGSPRGFSRSEKACLGTRSILWLSELPLLSYSTDMVAHHVLALSAVALVLGRAGPRRPLYFIYAGLITELFSDVVYMLKIAGKNAKNSRLFRAVMLANTVALLCIRFVAVLAVVIPLLARNGKSSDALPYMLCVAFFAAFSLYCVSLQWRVLGYVDLILERPARLRLLGRYDFSIFSMLLGTAMVAAQLSTARIYSLARTTPFTDAEVRSMALTGLGAAASGMFGASFGHPLFACRAQVETAHCADTGTKRGGIAIQAGVFCSAAFMLVARTLAPSLDKPVMIASMAASLPLGEGVGRIGCYFGGCCGSRAQAGRLRFGPVQLLSAGLNLSMYAALMFSLHHGTIDHSQAGSLAITSNAAIRLCVDPLRKTSLTRRNQLASPSTLFSLGQLLVSTAALAYVQFQRSNNSTQAACYASLASLSILALSQALTKLWRRAAQPDSSSTPSRRPPLACLLRPLTAVVTFALAVLFLVLRNALTTHSPSAPVSSSSFSSSSPIAAEGAATGLTLAQAARIPDPSPWMFSTKSLLLVSILTTGSIPLLTNNGKLGARQCGV